LRLEEVQQFFVEQLGVDLADAEARARAFAPAHLGPCHGAGAADAPQGIC
jgi:hypothetical protein